MANHVTVTDIFGNTLVIDPAETIRTLVEWLNNIERLHGAPVVSEAMPNNVPGRALALHIADALDKGD